MEKPPHILIIGAGLIGLSTADNLLARGAKVTLVDRRGGPAQGASFCNSGMIHPSQARPWIEGSDPEADRKVLALARTSAGLLKTRMAELQLPCEMRAKGTLQLYDSIAFGEAAKQQYDQLGIGCEVVTGQSFTYGRYALRFPDDHSGEAFTYCLALADDIARRGGECIYNAGDRDFFKFTKHADYIVIAAGAQSAQVASLFNLDLPIRALTGHALNFEKPDIPFPDVPVMHHASHSTLTVFKDHVRLSGTAYEKSPDALLDIWEEIAPDIISRLGDPVSRWSGDRPMCDYGRPIIGYSGRDNVWINTGHAHMGWTLSAGSGDLLARMLMSENVGSDFGFLPSE